MVSYRSITRSSITNPQNSDPIRFTPSKPLVYEMICSFTTLDCHLRYYSLSATCGNITRAFLVMSAQLCAGFHNLLQVVLDENECPLMLVSEINKMVVAHMRRLGLSHFIDMPNIVILGAEGGSSKRPKRRATPNSVELAEEGELPQCHAEETSTQESMLEEAS